jgi:hypothetical protein
MQFAIPVQWHDHHPIVSRQTSPHQIESIICFCGPPPDPQWRGSNLQEDRRLSAPHMEQSFSWRFPWLGWAKSPSCLLRDCGM